MKKLLLRIHPDFFHDLPQSRDKNEKSLAALNALLEQNGAAPTQKFTFDIRKNGNSVRTVHVNAPSIERRDFEGDISFATRQQKAFDALLSELMVSADIQLSKEEMQMRDAAQHDAPSMAEPTWIDTDQPFTKRGLYKAFKEHMRRYYRQNLGLREAVEKRFGVGRVGRLDPTLHLHALAPLLHDASVYSPLVRAELRAPALRTLRRHLVALRFEEWHELPVMLTLDEATREADAQLAAHEDAFLREFGAEYVCVPIGFERDVAATRDAVLASLPAVRSAKQTRSRQAQSIESLMTQICENDFALTSLSIEAPLALSVPTLQMLAQQTRETAPWLFRQSGACVLTGAHLSVVEPPPNAAAALRLPGSRYKQIRKRYGTAEAGTLSIDLRRARVRVPLGTSAEQLREFVSSATPRMMLATIERSAKHYERLNRQFLAACEHTRAEWGLEALVVDQERLADGTAKLLPPLTTHGDTVMAPVAFGPILAAHGVAERSLLVRASRAVAQLAALREQVFSVLTDRQNVVIMLSNRYETELADDNKNTVFIRVDVDNIDFELFCEALAA